MARDKTKPYDPSEWHDAYESETGYVLADRCGRELRLSLTASSKYAITRVRLDTDGNVIDRQLPFPGFPGSDVKLPPTMADKLAEASKDDPVVRASRTSPGKG